MTTPGLYPEGSEGPSLRTRDAIRAAVAADLSPKRVLSLGSRILFALGSAALACGLAAVSFGKKIGAIGEHPAEDIVAVVAIGLGVAAVVFGLSPLLGRRRSPREKLAIASLLAIPWFVYLAALMDATASGPHAKATACLAVSSAAGLLFAASALYVWRKTDPWAPRRSGALIGAAAGLVGGAGVSVACIFRGSAHLFIGHALVVPLLSLVGAALGERALRP